MKKLKNKKIKKSKTNNQNDALEFLKSVSELCTNRL